MGAALDHRRAAARRPAPVAEPPEPSHANGRGPDDAVAATELWTVVASLPEGQRSAVALRYAAGRRQREIATALECSEDAARRRVSDGLRSLRLRSRDLEELAR